MTEPFELPTKLEGDKAFYTEVGFSSKSQAHRMREEQTTLQSYIGVRGVCEKCGRKDMLSLDHIIPDALLKQFGVDIKRTFWTDNIQILCRLCNSFKGSQLDFTLVKTARLLKELIVAVEKK